MCSIFCHSTDTRSPLKQLNIFDYILMSDTKKVHFLLDYIFFQKLYLREKIKKGTLLQFITLKNKLQTLNLKSDNFRKLYYFISDVF